MSPLHQFKNIYNPYSFNPDDKQPSLHEEPEITSTVKPVGKEMADIEAEKDEVILKPDLSGIYKIKGKRHYAGGTPLQAEVGSFIFSDYNKMAISKDEQKLLKLKEGGSIKKQDNTPSEVLRRNIDIEHYNRMVNTLSDNKKDNISKKTSELMLSKYRDILGRIAYAQEKKKQFKDGTPDFVDNTAPVMSQSTQDKIDEQEQYKSGGMYLGKAQQGQYFGFDKYARKANLYPADTETPFQFNNKWYVRSNGKMIEVNSPQRVAFDNYALNPGATSPTLTTPQIPIQVASNPYSQPVDAENTPSANPSASNTQTQANGYPSWLKMWTNSNVIPDGYTTPTGQDSRYSKSAGNEIYDNYNYWKNIHGGNFKSGQDYQDFVYNHILSKDPSAISNMWNKMGITNKGRNSNNENEWGFADGYFGARTAALTGWRNSKPSNVIIPPQTKVTIQNSIPVTDDIRPTPEMDNKHILPYNPNIKKTLPMIGDEVWAGLQAAGIKRYDSYRQQVKSQLTQLNTVSSQNAINQLNAATNSAYQATRGMNPYMAQNTINEVLGKQLMSTSQVQGQYDQQNIGIENEQNKMNAQIQNKDMFDNSNYDKRYYDESVAANQNFDDAKAAGWNNFQSLRNQHQEELDSLYNTLAQQPLAGSKPILDKNGKPKLDAQGKPLYQGMPLYDVVPGTVRTYNTGVGNILNVQTGDRGDMQSQLTNNIIKNWNNYSTEERTQWINMLKVMSLKSYAPSQHKTGGFVFKNPYK